MQLDPLHIVEIAPKCPASWAKELSRSMPFYGIDTIQRAAMFIAQCAHESAGFTVFEENLNYSVQSLMKVWPARFPTQMVADLYARKPQALASYVYANRMGNGNEDSGDGWKYRGRGCIQLTGKVRYLAAQTKIGYAFVEKPDGMLLPEYGAQVACWYWESNRLNEVADTGDFRAVTKAINGGYIGMEDRERWLANARSALSMSIDELQPKRFV